MLARRVIAVLDGPAFAEVAVREYDFHGLAECLVLDADEEVYGVSGQIAVRPGPVVAFDEQTDEGGVLGWVRSFE